MAKKSNVIDVKIAVDKTRVDELPKYAIPGDLGLDIVATNVEWNETTDSYIYRTGVYMESDKNVGGFLFTRSGNYKTDAYLANSVGVIETFTYRGELCFCYKNRESIETRVDRDTLLDYMNLPWYKKLFSSSTEYNRLWTENYVYQRNHALDYAPYEVGERVGQIVFLKDIPQVNLIEVTREELSKTERGEGGLGHTGK